MSRSRSLAFSLRSRSISSCSGFSWPWPGKTCIGSALKHFTAYDPIAKWTVGKAFNRATAQAAASFLDKLTADMPFPVKAIQVDGGSEFMAEFEDACQARGSPSTSCRPARRR